jgi:hypothetical protein
MKISLQNVKLFVLIVYNARCGDVSVLAKKVSFVNGIPDNDFRSEIRNVYYAIVYVFKFAIFCPYCSFGVAAFVVVFAVVVMSLSSS